MRMSTERLERLQAKHQTDNKLRVRIRNVHDKAGRSTLRPHGIHESLSYKSKTIYLSISKISQ